MCKLISWFAIKITPEENNLALFMGLMQMTPFTLLMLARFYHNHIMTNLPPETCTEIISPNWEAFALLLFGSIMLTFFLGLGNVTFWIQDKYFKKGGHNG